MDIKEIVNKGSRNAAAAAAAVANGTAGAQDIQLFQSISRANSLPTSETNSERANSPHGSEHSRYSASRMSQLNGMNGAPSNVYYPPPNQVSMLQQPFHPDNNSDNISAQQDAGALRQSSRDGGTQKNFQCSTCGKGFARRSDLARHERIHSGVRPHVCDYQGCGKQFIQRSALTVHRRVHTGEKPHICERCSKPFSDSSSLARHRRIHSGKRPYKCPYADCQKTFTRRTTLTRHQNHHTGTVEEAAAATAAALAAHSGSNCGSRQRSDGESYSNAGSPMSTPSPGQRDMSGSPQSEHAPMKNMQRPSEYGFVSNSSLPGHLRGEFGMSNQQPMTSAPYTNSMRPTSHPAGHGPPTTLEPPANFDQQRQPGSASASPHMSSVGWQSPSHMPSPSNSNSYVYPDPDPYGPGAMGYYPSSNIRRPQSTEPEGNDFKRRITNADMWATAP